jgi:hypothetical protein
LQNFFNKKSCEKTYTPNWVKAGHIMAYRKVQCIDEPYSLIMAKHYLMKGDDEKALQYFFIDHKYDQIPEYFSEAKEDPYCVQDWRAIFMLAGLYQDYQLVKQKLKHERKKNHELREENIHLIYHKASGLRQLT